MLRYIKSLIGPVIASVLVVGVSNAAMYQWSKTPASNATADPTINFSEGMSPSSVNDSARAMMARMAEYRDDISGSITTAGSGSAYTVTTNQGLPSPPTTGQLIAFTPHADSAGSATLAVDAGTAYPIQTSPAQAVAAGTLVLGTPYSAKFNGTAWVLTNFYGNASVSFLVPIGGMIPYTGTTAPNSNFILPYGQCISRTTYASYFAQVSTTFGVCDGTTTFGVPDMRGRVVAGQDNMGGTSANRLTGLSGGVNGDTFGATGGVETHTLTTAEMPSHLHAQTAQTPTFNYSTGSTTSGPDTRISGLSTGDPGSTITTAGDTTPGDTGLTGGGAAHNNIQPTIILSYILRII